MKVLKLELSNSLLSEQKCLFVEIHDSLFVNEILDGSRNASRVSKPSEKKAPINLQRLQEEKYPELSMRSFFEFIRTAYQVNDSFEEVANTLSLNSEIDWSALAKTALSPPKSGDKSKQNESVLENEASKSPNPEEMPPETEELALAKTMKKNLSDVLHEGLLDSVLPYMIPRAAFSQPVIKKTQAMSDSRKISSLVDNRVTNSSKDKDKEKARTRRKSFESEIEIHVCDEAKNVKKDFRCPQRLLIQNMCYFADVTAGQKLEEMDISVHCDIVIFDWLMRWVKRDIIKKSEWPALEASNVIPIMVSASFLQMEPLLNSCLIFCHDNMTDILKTSSIFTCLNDALLTRLADLFTNVEVETLKDKKDKIQSRLFCKLIVSLANAAPDNSRGHYNSLSTLFKCGKCGKNIVRSLSDSVPCIPSSMRIDSRGNLHSKHSRHLTWNLNDYVIALRSELRSWRKVYWRLWGDCHFTFCRQCDTYFPVNQMDWCCYHPENPQFFVNEQLRSVSYPVGRFPCCSQRAFRFEALPNREGCKFREHSPRNSNVQEREVIEIFLAYRDVVALEPPQLFFPEKITRLVARDSSLEPGKLSCKESTWWEGLELAPQRPKLGLLGKIWGGSTYRTALKSRGKLKRQTTENSFGSSDSESDDDDAASDCGDSSVEEESCNSEESQKGFGCKATAKPRKKHRVFHAKRTDTGVWNAELTVRCNQDNQRDFEEKVATQMTGLLSRRTSVEQDLLEKPQNWNKQHWNGRRAIGGTYVKLEAEFREQLKKKGENLTRSKCSA